MRQKILSLLVILALYPITSFAQDILKMPAPVDEEIRYGVLENGMTYYIRHNEEPKERASFYIIQNVGALLEEDNQNGLAHFLEHMAFNGTEHFPDKGIINTLEKHGVAFGRNINAYTAFNETVYNLSDVPVNKEGLLDTCLLVLNDWSNYLLLTEKEIDAERGVISEEWRTRRDASFRMRAKWFPVVFGDSKYSVRDVIGDLDIIKNHDYETLRKFYHDWYRTDLQAIAMVGDFDVDEMEAKVKEMFSKIPAVENAQERPFFEVPEHDETRFVVATDKEAQLSQIQVFMKRRGVDKKDKNLGYIRDNYITGLFNTMMSERISELLQKGEPPFINGQVSNGGFIRGYEASVIATTAKPNQEDIALRAIYTEALRVKRHGFTAGESNRAKTNMLTSMESAYKQRDKIRNDAYISGMQKHFLTGEPLTSAEFDWQFGQKILETIQLDEVSAKAKEWITDKNRAIMILGPESEDIKHLSKEEAMAILAEVEQSEITPYEDEGEVASLINEELAGSKIVSTKKLDEFNAVEWKLANNATVIYRHADYEKDNVSLKAYSLGGTSKFENDKMASAMMLPQFIGAFGVGEFDAVTLRKVLTGKKASLQAGMSSLMESFNGSSTPKDFETMMQLLYLQFANPRFDEEAYSALKSRYIAYLANMANDPKKIMGDTLTRIMTNYNPRIRLMNSELFEDISIQEMETLYNDRFIDVGDFTFFIVGNIEEAIVKEMAEKYIGSLKDDPRTEKWIDRQVEAPKGKTEKVIEIALETAKANVNINLNKEMTYSPESNIKLSVLKAILDLRYTEEVREKEGGTYGVSVRSSSSHFPKEEKSLQMQFDCDPEKAEHLKSIIFREIDKIAENGPTAEDLDKVVKNMKKNREQTKPHNGYWMSSLYNYYVHGYNSDAKENFEEIVDSLTVSDIKEFTTGFLKGVNIVDVVFKPKAE